MNTFRSAFVCIAVVCQIGCDSEPWKTMNVELASGTTPEEVLAELRRAESERDLPKFYGCLTHEARQEQISSLVLDMHVVAARHKYGSERFPLGDNGKALARECIAVFQKHGVPVVNHSSEPNADHVANPDSFVKDAWKVWFPSDKNLIDKEAKVPAIVVDGDFAFGKVEGFKRRFRSEWGYVRFKKIEGQWFVDQTPWWMPWGAPPQIKREQR